jgi:hypothetical protein
MRSLCAQGNRAQATAVGAIESARAALVSYGVRDAPMVGAALSLLRCVVGEGGAAAARAARVVRCEVHLVALDAIRWVLRGDGES